MKHNTIKELSIQVNLNGLSFCILNRTLNSIEYLKRIDFQNKLTPFDVLHRLKTELSADSVFSDDFNAVTIIHQNELSTLVPKELYNERQKADYLKFNAKILKTDFITHDEITINNSINVYIPYVNINNYIFETFGEFIYKHSSTVLVDTLLQKCKVGENTNVYINVNSNAIEMMVIADGKLQLFNNFEYYSKEDFIYYVLFVFEQLKLDTERVPIKLSGYIEKEDELFNILFTYIRHVDFINADYDYKLTDTTKAYKLYQYYLILNSF